MNTSHVHMRGSTMLSRTQAGKTCLDGPQTKPRPHLSNQEMEQLVPIKMQHAAARFITTFLAQAKNGWTGEETEVGSEDDRRGIDFRLINRAQRVEIPVDFSLSSKDGHAVKLHREWFKEEEDGSFTFIPCFTQALVRAFLPAMDPNNWQGLVGWKEAQRA